MHNLWIFENIEEVICVVLIAAVIIAGLAAWLILKGRKNG